MIFNKEHLVQLSIKYWWHNYQNYDHSEIIFGLASEHRNSFKSIKFFDDNDFGVQLGNEDEEQILQIGETHLTYHKEVKANNDEIEQFNSEFDNLRDKIRKAFKDNDIKKGHYHLEFVVYQFIPVKDGSMISKELEKLGISMHESWLKSNKPNLEITFNHELSVKQIKSVNTSIKFEQYNKIKGILCISIFSSGILKDIKEEDEFIVSILEYLNLK